MAPIIVHHLHVSQSERIPWVCEELGVPYEIREHFRAPLLAPPELVAMHPSGSAPVIQDGDLVLAESCAIIEYICHRHGGGRLFVPPGDPAYADFLYWWHWADGTLQPNVMRPFFMSADRLRPDQGPLLESLEGRRRRSLGQIEERLKDNKYLAGGDRFTAADVMVLFSLTTARGMMGLSLAGYPNILRYLADIGQREAYKTAMAKCEPGMELALGAEPPKVSLAM